MAVLRLKFATNPNRTVDEGTGAFSWLHRRRRQPYTVDTISQLFCCRWNAKNETHNAAMRILAIVLKKSQTFSQDRTTQKVRFLSCPRYVAHTGVGRVVKNGPELNLIWGKRPLNSEFPLLRKERIIRTNSNHEGISIVLVSNPHGENFRVKLRVTLTKRIINFWLSLSPLFFFFIVKSSTRESYDGFAEEEKDSKTQIKINGQEKPTPNKTQVSIDARSPSNHQEPAKKTPV
jgi:hypothetical protein